MLLSECPSLASLMMKASTSSGWYLHQLGGRLLTGLIEWDFPFSCFGILCHLSIKTHSTRIFKNAGAIRTWRILALHVRNCNGYAQRRL